jgi:beta-phosphoglucomutase family hydrolase
MRCSSSLNSVLGLPDSITVVLFDLDGVLASSTVVHREAWKRTFDTFLRAQDGEEYVPFDEQDYFDHIDGRLSTDGVHTFLRSRRIDASAETVQMIGAAKNATFLAALAGGAVTAYPGSIRYLAAAQRLGLRIGVVTSSTNSKAVLDAAGLSRFVQHRIDGIEISRTGMRGKPAPDSFLACAAAFGATPPETAVFEDALSGVQAGRAGGFGFVVGIDHVGENQAAAMRAAGADVVVRDLDELLTA